MIGDNATLVSFPCYKYVTFPSLSISHTLCFDSVCSLSTA